MSKKFFDSAPIKKASQNAMVGDPHAGRYTYIRAYFQAAEILANTALRSGPKDLLFYPVLFNLRHYLELHLKNLIVGAEQLYLVMDELGDAKGKLDAIVQDQLDQTHSIQKLFNLFEARLRLVLDEVFDATVRKTIIELHNIDPDGQAFRYHERTRGGPSMPDVKHYDLWNILEKMIAVRDILFGVDLWLDDHCGIASSIPDSMKPD